MLQKIKNSEDAAAKSLPTDEQKIQNMVIFFDLGLIFLILINF